MADVNASPAEARDRGQMILIAAFGVAVMLVVLALILNTAIYTENIATRGSDISGGKDAARYRVAAEASFEGTVSYVNYHNNTTADSLPGYGPLADPVRQAVWDYDNISGREQAMDGIVTNVSLKRQSRGTRIYQNRNADFTGEAGERNWTLVENTQHVRNLTIDATEADLTQHDPSDHSPPVFFVNVTDSTDPDGEWYRVYLFEDDTDTSAAVVQVATKSDGHVGQCSAEFGSDDRVTLEVTAGRFGGEPCRPLLAVEDAYSDDFDVRFNNSEDSGGTDLVAGRYTLVTNKSYGTVTSVSAAAPQPDKTRAIYSTTVHLVYETKRLYFETDVRVAPGETDG